MKNKLKTVPACEVWSDGKRNYYAGEAVPEGAKKLYSSNVELKPKDKK